MLRCCEYIIFRYFLCGTFGIWKKARPFISGTKGSVQGHADLGVNTSHSFSCMELKKLKEPLSWAFYAATYCSSSSHNTRGKGLVLLYSCAFIFPFHPRQDSRSCASTSWSYHQRTEAQRGEETQPRFRAREPGPEIRSETCLPSKVRY